MIDILLFFSIFAICCLSRFFMFKMISCVKFSRSIALCWAAYGSFRDMFFISFLYLFAFLFHLFYLPTVIFTTLVTICIVFIIILTIVDTVFFYQYSSRIDFAVIQNINFISIFANLTTKNIFLAIPALVCLALFTYLLYFGINNCTDKSPLLFYTVLIGTIFGTFCFFTKHSPDYTKKTYYTVGLHDIYDSVVRTAIVYNTEHILSSSLWNLLTLLHTFKFPKQLTYMEISQEQNTFLESIGLHQNLQPAKYLEHLPTKQYKRIIILTLESICSRYIHKYNRMIPPEVTPFLNLLCKKYISFNNFSCSITPTVNAMYALLASRLDILEGKPYRDAKYETLLSSLRKENYTSYILRGTTKEFGGHAQFYPRAYKCDSLLAHEEIEKNYPQGTKNGWGFSDPFVYKYAIDVLKEQKENKLCLIINTIDTHPPYSHTFSEQIFPEVVQKSASRLFRSLYQMDIELMHFYLQLEENSLLDENTLLFIMGDHSPGYGPEYREITGARDFFPARVPLLCVSQDPNAFHLLDVNQNFCSLNFYPTFCDAFHLPIPHSAWGQSLFRERNPTLIQRQNSLYSFTNTNKKISIDLNNPQNTLEYTALTSWINNCQIR